MVEFNFIVTLLTLIIGIMITKDDLKELFEPLFRED
jgi:hypothetical protein